MNAHYAEDDSLAIESNIVRVIPEQCYTGIIQNNENFFSVRKSPERSFDEISDESEHQSGYGSADNLHFELWSLPFFVDFIIENHHHFVKKQIPLLTELIEHVVSKHGKSFPALFDIQKLFNGFSESFYKHIFRKEEELFSYIKKLHRTAEEGKQIASPYFGSIIELENQLSEEHSAVENDLLQLRQITSNFIAPENSCTNHKRIYKLLKALYHDTKQHIYLENNLVFPEALELEKKVLIKETSLSFSL